MSSEPLGHTKSWILLDIYGNQDVCCYLSFPCPENAKNSYYSTSMTLHPYEALNINMSCLWPCGGLMKQLIWNAYVFQVQGVYHDVSATVWLIDGA